MQRRAAFENPIQGVQPHRSLQLHVAQDGFQALRDISEVRPVVVEFAGRTLAEVLHQQEIDFVARGIGVCRLCQKMLHQRHQPVAIDHRTGLQELPQLVHLDAVIHIVQPLLRLLHRLLIGCVDGLIKRGERPAHQSQTRVPVLRKQDGGGAHSTTAPQNLEPEIPAV